jgi:signal transduction histidine kinase
VEVKNWEPGHVNMNMGPISAAVIKARRALIDTGTKSDGLSSPDHLAAGLRSGMYAPLYHHGEVIGSLNVKSKKRNAYKEDDLKLLQTLANQISGAIAAARLHAKELEAAGRREAHIRLEAQNHALEQENTFKSNLISTVSHELRTPLTGVISMADILRKNRQGNLSDRQLQQIEVIRRSGCTLLLVTNDLLTASSIESGKLKLQLLNVDVKTLFKELAQSMEPLFSLKMQRLVVTDEGPEQIKADPFRTEQIIANLLSNASKYSPAETTVRLSARRNGERIVISVQDEGPGIPAKDQSRLFDTYFRANDSLTASQSGTGLGLFIVKTLVEAHDGKVTVKSVPGRGSTFTVELPVAGPGASRAKAA